jgi:hypothetical protein
MHIKSMSDAYERGPMNGQRFEARVRKLTDMGYEKAFRAATSGKKTGRNFTIRK